MFPENVYHISEKGRQAMEPYSILRDNDAHALGLSYYRLMQAKEAQPDEENNVILTQLLSEDIQKCYQEQNRAAFQRVIGTTGRFMREVENTGFPLNVTPWPSLCGSTTRPTISLPPTASCTIWPKM